MSAFSTQAHVTDDLFGGDLARASPTTAVNEPCHCATPNVTGFGRRFCTQAHIDRLWV